MRKQYLLITGALVIGAAVVMMTDRDGTKGKDNRLRQTLFAAEQFAGVEKISITQGEQKILLEKVGDSDWQVAPQVEGQAAFPADAKQVASLVDALTKVKVQELLASKKTSWEGMGLDHPKVLTFSGKDKELFGAYFGDNRKTGGQFVSFNTDERAYLISEPVTLNLEKASWELKNLVNIKAEAIKAVTFHPSPAAAPDKSAAARIFREKPEDPLKLEIMAAKPDPKVVDAAVTAVGSVLADLSFVRRHDLSNEEAKTAMLKPARMTVDLFDGRVVVARVGKVDGAQPKYFVHLEISPGQSTAKLDANSEQVNRLMSAWAFEISSWIGERMTKSYGDFIEKPAAPSAASRSGVRKL